MNSPPKKKNKLQTNDLIVMEDVPKDDFENKQTAGVEKVNNELSETVIHFENDQNSQAN